MSEINFRNLYEQLLNKEKSLSLIGLGYVGMPIAVAFAKRVDVIGFDSKVSYYYGTDTNKF